MVSEMVSNTADEKQEKQNTKCYLKIMSMRFVITFLFQTIIENLELFVLFHLDN